MQISRHQKALQKMEAYRARKRLQATAAETVTKSDMSPEVEKSEISPEKTVENEMLATRQQAKVVTPPRKESQHAQNTDKQVDEEEMNNIPPKDGIPPHKASEIPAVEIGTKETDMGVVEDVPHDEPLPSASPRRVSEIETQVATPKTKVTTARSGGEQPNKVTPESSQRRYAKTAGGAGDTNTPRSRRVPLKQPPKPHNPSKSKKDRKQQQRSRGRSRGVRDDDSSVDSRPEKGRGKSDGIASALDPFFDFLMDDRSIGEDSASIRSERTFEKVDVVKDVEDFIMERMGCGKTSDIHDLGSRTFSMDEEESTLSGGNDVAKHDSTNFHGRGKLSNSPSEELSATAADDEATYDTATPASPKLAGRKLAAEPELAHATSFDMQEPKRLCADIYQITNELFEDTMGARTNADSKNEPLFENENRQTTAAKAVLKSDASFQGSLKASLRDTSSYASTFISSIRDAASFNGADNKNNGVEESGPLVTNVLSSETRSVVQTDPGEEDTVEQDGVYAPAEDVHSAASFFTATAPTTKATGSAFEEAIAKVKTSLGATAASTKLIELQESIVGGAMVPEESWSGEKFYEAFSCACSSEAKESSQLKQMSATLPIETPLASTPETSAETAPNDDAPRIDQSIVAKIRNILTCGPLEADIPLDQQTPEVKSDESIMQKVKNVLTFSDSKSESGNPSDTPQVENVTVEVQKTVNVVNEKFSLRVNIDESDDDTVVIAGDEVLLEAGLDPAEPIAHLPDENIESPETPLKNSTPSAPLKNHCVETPETSTCTEDEAEADADQKNISTEEELEETESHFHQTTFPETTQGLTEAVTAQIANLSLANDKSSPPTKKRKKWGALRRVVRPLFRKKKQDEKLVVVSEIAENKQNPGLNSLRERETLGDQSIPTVSNHQEVAPRSFGRLPSEDIAQTLYDASLIAQAKRDAWRGYNGDGFDAILSKNARERDWGKHSPELLTAANDAISQASF